MPRLMFVAAVALAVAALAGCSGKDETPPEATPAETATAPSATPAGEPGAHRLTLTDAGCTYVGATTFSSAETFEAEVVNESSRLGAFEIARLDEEHAFAEVEAYVASERKRMAKGEFTGPPIWMTLGERAQLEPGQMGMLVSAVTPGTWVLWCAQEHPPTALFLMPALELT